MKRTITKMLHAHASIRAAKLESAIRPLPRALKNSLTGERCTGIAGALSVAGARETAGLTGVGAPCSRSILMRRKTIRFRQKVQSDSTGRRVRRVVLMSPKRGGSD